MAQLGARNHNGRAYNHTERTCRIQIRRAMAMAMSTTSSLGTTRLQFAPQLPIRKTKTKQQRVSTTIRASLPPELVEASQSAPPDLTWQIWAGAIAGVTPFVVAGIEFSKRIAAQQRCSKCNGSGLVKLSGSYFRCGKCGGFLPWYSWRRFFKG